MRKTDLKRATLLEPADKDVSFADSKLLEVDLRTAKFEKRELPERRPHQGDPVAHEPEAYSFVAANFANCDASEVQAQGVNSPGPTSRSPTFASRT